MKTKLLLAIALVTTLAVGWIPARASAMPYPNHGQIIRVPGPGSCQVDFTHGNYFYVAYAKMHRYLFNCANNSYMTLTAVKNGQYVSQTCSFSSGYLPGRCSGTGQYDLDWQQVTIPNSTSSSPSSIVGTKLVLCNGLNPSSCITYNFPGI